MGRQEGHDSAAGMIVDEKNDENKEERQLPPQHRDVVVYDAVLALRDGARF